MRANTSPLLLLLVLLIGDTASVADVGTVDMSEDLVQDASHDCFRNCSSDPTARICHYTFKAEYYTTLSKACYECPNPESDCIRQHCVAADGVKRPIVTVNRRMPGPTVQVCQGDEIMVDLHNELMSDTTAIHWHGLHMVGTPYMDGVPQLTQCAILAGTVFRLGTISWLINSAPTTGTPMQVTTRSGGVEERARQRGSPQPQPTRQRLPAAAGLVTGSEGFQRTDGMFGSLTVRGANDPLLPLYDVDDPSHLLLITDWLEKLGMEKFVYHHHSEHDNKPYNILVNGRGYASTDLVHRGIHPALSAMTVRKGLRYRVRTISNSIQNCPIEVSVDGHSLLLIAKDGTPMEPITVESFVIYGGERWDFVLEANKAVGNYWIKYHGLLDCDDRFKSAHQVSVLRYEGAPDTLPSPVTNITWLDTKREGFQVNTLNQAPGNAGFKTAAEIHSTGSVPDYSATPDYSFWMDFDFHGIDNELFHDAKLYPFLGVPKKHRLFMPQMNYITLSLPPSPPLSQPQDMPPNKVCNSDHPPSTPRGNCTVDFCACLHMLSVELNSLVELVLVDKGVTYYANHPFHLHGHAFAVLGMERLGNHTTLEAIKQLETEGRLMRNFDRPAIMDTVTVPDGGYTVLRFRATNPGYWLFHCHIAFHMEVGMGLVFKVGDQSMLPPVPENFPKCGSWQSPRSSDLKTSIGDWLVGLGDGDGAVSIHLLPAVNSSGHTDGAHYNINNNAYSGGGGGGNGRGSSSGLESSSASLAASAVTLVVALSLLLPSAFQVSLLTDVWS